MLPAWVANTPNPSNLEHGCVQISHPGARRKRDEASRLSMKPLPTERGSSSVSSASRPMTMPGGPTQYRISRHDDSAAAPYRTWTPAGAG